MSVRALTRSPWLGTRACPTTLWLRKGRLAATTHLRKKRNTAKRPTVFRLFVPDRPAIGSLRSTESRGDQAGKERERERERDRTSSWPSVLVGSVRAKRSRARPEYGSPFLSESRSDRSLSSPLFSSPLLSSPRLSSSPISLRPLRSSVRSPENFEFAARDSGPRAPTVRPFPLRLIVLPVIRLVGEQTGKCRRSGAVTSIRCSVDEIHAHDDVHAQP